jgi:hypothetical protein
MLDALNCTAYIGGCRGYQARVNHMSVQWHEWFIGKSSFRESSLFVVAGSLITLVSLAMPWYEKVYLLSTGTVSAGEILAGFIFRCRPVPALSVISIACLAALALAAPFLKKRLAALLVLPACGLAAAMLYYNAVPFERFTWGLIVTGTGLLFISLGFFGKE